MTHNVCSQYKHLVHEWLAYPLSYADLRDCAIRHNIKKEDKLRINLKWFNLISLHNTLFKN